MSISAKIAISIVTYNSQDIFKTVENFQKQILPFYSVELLIFDNHSSVDFQKKLQSLQNSQVRVKFYRENRGFGYGHNTNAQRTDAEYFLVCNPDVLIDRKNFELMNQYLREHKNVVVAPKVLNSDGTTQYLFRRHLDVFDYFLRFMPSWTGMKKIFRKRLARFECWDLADETQEVLFASGCFLFMRRSDFLAVDGFDERFFMYFEDNDFCQKIRQEQKKIIYFPDAEIIHFYGKEAHRSFKVFKIFMQSMRKYFKKWGWHFF